MNEKIIFIAILSSLVAICFSEECADGEKECKEGFFCFEGKCTENLMAPGCESNDDCEGKARCSLGECVTFMTEEDRQKIQYAESEAKQEIVRRRKKK